MTILRERLAAMIAAQGPIPVSDYMAICLFDPEHGYYTTREAFGRGGDFITAPEVSQMFGELVGIWTVSAWQTLGRPENVIIAEIGPGRGTLMKDMARTIARTAPDLHSAARFHLIEISLKLAAEQVQTLKDAPGRFDWTTDVAELPDGPLIIIGNELFDAVPIHQYTKIDGIWRERLVGLDDAGRLAFVVGPQAIDPALLPQDAVHAPDGAIAELAPARVALMDRIAARIATQSGAGLFIDYGHLRSGLGDTLQAMRSHAYDGLLDHPGEADLTSHVDFEPLAAQARAHGLETASSTQGQFLLAMGLLERAGRLGSGAATDQQDRIRADVERLAAPDQMGDLFKVLCIASESHLPPPFPILS